MSTVENLEMEPVVVQSLPTLLAEETAADSMDSYVQVMVIYTGGTIGMKRTSRGYVPAPGWFGEHLLSLPQFHEADESRKNRGFCTHILPRSSKSDGGASIAYKIMEYSPLLDSCNMSHRDWARIAKDIEKNYDAYEAFVVLHGTDTMAYTASALSFMLESLGKTVIVTGSQIPLSQPRSDALDNLLGALTIAGNFTLPEVSLFFHNRLLRGNRATKFDASQLDAFASHNMEPLATIGVAINVAWHLVLPPPPSSAPCRARTNFNQHVSVITLFPGLSVASLEAQLAPPLRGAVLQTFGAGNAPDQNSAFLDVLKRAHERGVVVVNITQCSLGVVEAHYATGTALAENGVLAGSDMSVEAALTKLGWMLGQSQESPPLSPGKSARCASSFGMPGLTGGAPPEPTPVPLDNAAVRRHMMQNFRGEMLDQAGTEGGVSLGSSSFVRAVYSTLKEQLEVHRSAGRSGADGDAPLQRVRDAILPTLMCSAAAIGNVGELAGMISDGADPSCSDYDQRSPLHIAASEGQLSAVAVLLEHGADPSAVDRWGGTPLADAVKQVRSFHVFDYLLSFVAHLLGIIFCSLLTRCAVNRDTTPSALRCAQRARSSASMTARSCRCSVRRRSFGILCLRSPVRSYTNAPLRMPGRAPHYSLRIPYRRARQERHDARAARTLSRQWGEPFRSGLRQTHPADDRVVPRLIRSRARLARAWRRCGGDRSLVAHRGVGGRGARLRGNRRDHRRGRAVATSRMTFKNIVRN